MRGARGTAFMWLLVLLSLSTVVVSASLWVSRAMVRDRQVALERADGLFYAGVALERGVAFLRQHTDFAGRYVGPVPSLSGSVLVDGLPVAFVIDLSQFNAAGSAARSVLVTVTPSGVLGGDGRSFSARARLRPDLSVGEWFVVDAALPVSSAPPPTLPLFASCSASTPRLSTVAVRSANRVDWSWGTSERPDSVRVRWFDFRSGSEQVVTVSGSALSANVTTPFPAVAPYAPVTVPYRVEALFEGRVVDSCVVDVVSGRYAFEVLSPNPCATGDSVVVRWDANADSGVRLVYGRVSILGSLESLTVASTQPRGSVVIPAPARVLLYWELLLRLEGPSSLGLPATLRIPLGSGC